MTPDNSQLWREYVGIPYRSPETVDGDGLNCWELVEKVMREVFGANPPHVDYIGPDDGAAPVFMERLAYWQYVPFEDRQPGDLITFRIMGHVIHCGILVTNEVMLHTMQGRMSCLENILSAEWARRMSGIYRWGPMCIR